MQQIENRHRQKVRHHVAIVGFTIDEREHSLLKAPWYPCREKPSPLSRHVFMTLDAWLTANLISLSYITGLLMTLNAQTERGTFM